MLQLTVCPHLLQEDPPWYQATNEPAISVSVPLLTVSVFLLISERLDCYKSVQPILARGMQLTFRSGHHLRCI